jgi:hypothetical protein
MFLYEVLALAGLVFTAGMFGWVMINLKQWNKEAQK